MAAVKTSLTSATTPQAVLDRLTEANRKIAAAFPGETERRQPVHTVYGGAHLFKARTAPRSGEVALEVLRTYAPDLETFTRALVIPSGASPSDPKTAQIAAKVHERVLEKLGREPIEDFRIDFEDGYGNRPDAEEDGHAVQAATEVASGLEAGVLPPFIGIRIKPLNEELRARSIRTLDLFVTTLWERAGKRLPEGFVITLPKVTAPEQVEALTALLGALETALGMPSGTLKFELMVETTQSIIAPDGSIALPKLVSLGQGRIVGAHFGTYDYTASCNITAAHQHMAHPACDFAKHVMKVSLAGTGVMLSDGATNVMPVGPHRAEPGKELSDAQRAENQAVVHRAWAIALGHIRASLVNGFYQGWDLHPAQLPARYAAVYTFFLEGLDAAGARLRSFVEKAAQATLLGDVFDDAATGQGLLNYFLRAVGCGALTVEEAEQISGLTAEEIRSRSFVKILAGRRG
jgi:citrate lyase beta subunit